MLLSLKIIQKLQIQYHLSIIIYIVYSDFLETTVDTKIDFNIADLIFQDIHIISINIYFAGPKSSLIL